MVEAVSQILARCNKNNDDELEAADVRDAVRKFGMSTGILWYKPYRFGGAPYRRRYGLWYSSNIF